MRNLVWISPAVDETTLWVTPVPKGSTYAQAAMHSQKIIATKKRQIICYLMKTLPTELRKMIWRFLVVRPTGIVPGYIHLDGPCRRSKYYGYQWDDERERDRLYSERDGYGTRIATRYGQNMALHRHSDPGSIKIVKTSKPTWKQLEAIESGCKSLENTTDKETGHTIEHTLIKREGMLTVILNTKYETLGKFKSLAIMRTSKEISLEVRDVFYRENTFVFDTRARASITDYHHGNPKPATLFWQRTCIPGLPKPNGAPMTEQRISTTLQNMFDKKPRQPTYIFEDPLMRFFNIIGPINAFMVSKMKIEGHYKVTEVVWDSLPTGLPCLLPMYSEILKKVCVNLRVLTIHMGTDTRPVYMGPGPAGVKMYEVDLEQEEPFGRNLGSDDDKIDEMIKTVVDALPSLTELKLGDYKSEAFPEKDVKWGKAVRWIDVVDERSRQPYQAVKASEDKDEGQPEDNFGYSGCALGVKSSIFGTRGSQEGIRQGINGHRGF